MALIGFMSSPVLVKAAGGEDGALGINPAPLS